MTVGYAAVTTKDRRAHWFVGGPLHGCGAHHEYLQTAPYVEFTLNGQSVVYMKTMWWVAGGKSFDIFVPVTSAVDATIEAACAFFGIRP